MIENTCVADVYWLLGIEHAVPYGSRSTRGPEGTRHFLARPVRGGYAQRSLFRIGPPGEGGRLSSGGLLATGTVKRRYKASLASACAFRLFADLEEVFELFRGMSTLFRMARPSGLTLTRRNILRG